MKKINERDAIWLALLFDCEGSITINARNVSYGIAHQAWITVGMYQNPAILKKACEIIGEGKVLSREEKNDRTRYYLQYGSKQAANIIIEMYPHLLIKQRQARAVLHLERTKTQKGKRPITDEKKDLRKRLKDVTNKLNRFEEVDDSFVQNPPLLIPFERNKNFMKHITGP